MAEKETKNKLKNLIEPDPEALAAVNIESVADAEKRALFSRRRFGRFKEEEQDLVSSWVPKTALGKLVKSGKEKDIDKILDTGKKILEPEIVDFLLKPEVDLLMIGQAKGKFGGGKRRIWRQTQKKTQEGNVISFATLAVVGDKNGHVGVGYGKAQETLPSREKSIRHAKLNLMRVERGFEDPSDIMRDNPHTVPFKVSGKCGSVKITLFPAPRGTGLVVAGECKKVLKLAGIKDVYSRTSRQTRTTFNLIKASIDALKKTREVSK